MRTIFTKALRSTFARSILVAATVGATASWGTIAMAQTQVPREMRTQAMSLAQVCRNDYERLCHDVQPGGGRILGCLSASAEKLSPACRGALPDAQALASAIRRPTSRTMALRGPQTILKIASASTACAKKPTVKASVRNTGRPSV